MDSRDIDSPPPSSRPKKADHAPNSTEPSFQTRQAAMLAKRTKTPARALGRARVESIIGTAIELMREHNPGDITISMIAAKAGMTRTLVYAHFKNMDDILEQISIRFLEQTGLYVEEYIRKRNPKTLPELLTLTIDATYKRFSRPRTANLAAVASHVPYDARVVVKDFEQAAALLYHSFWKPDWPVEPLSEHDPFCILVRLQEAIFSASIRKHDCITKDYAELAKHVALDFMAGVERRFLMQQIHAGTAHINTRLSAAVNKLSTASDPRLLTIAVEQLESLATIIDASQ